MSRITSIVVAPLFALLAMNGQTPGAGITTVPNLKALTLESVVPIDGIDSTVTPNIPADLLSAFTSGTMELRQQLNYDAAAQTLKVTGIAEAAGSPLPTPAGAAGVTTLWTYTVNVERVELSAKPANAVLFFGTAASGSTGTPFGDISGALVSVSTGYTVPVDASAPTTFSGIAANLAGAATLFSKQGTGKLITSSGTGGSGVPVAVAGPKNFISGNPQFQLDATHSTDPGGGTLTYHWVFMPVFGTTANLVGADTATPTVTVPSYSDAEGDYTFQLTVTNAAGLSATDTVTITYTPGHTDNQPQ
ncbi:MAG: PKD domain-containing protein [Bryobacteraceae bacterium]